MIEQSTECVRLASTTETQVMNATFRLGMEEILRRALCRDGFYWKHVAPSTWLSICWARLSMTLAPFLFLLFFSLGLGAFTYCSDRSV